MGITRGVWTGHAFEDGDAGPVLAGLVVNHGLGVPLNTRKACEGARNGLRHVEVPARNAPGAVLASGLVAPEGVQLLGELRGKN